MNKPVIVMKFGGSSLSEVLKIKHVADLVTKRSSDGYKVVVVVSALGKTTDDLLKLAKDISESPHKRELDMLLTVGERVSMALLSMAIRDLGYESISLTGSQCGIITNDVHVNAKIIEVRPYRIEDELEKGKIVIVAGFQGISYKKEITTLGRGGSDTTAVSLAAALDAEWCEIYSDVDGVYTGDPAFLNPIHLPEITYESMQEMSYRGAKVLNYDAVEYAKRKNIAIYAKATKGSNKQTVLRKDLTIPMHGVLSVAYSDNLQACEVSDTKSLKRFYDYCKKLKIKIKYLLSKNFGFLIFTDKNEVIKGSFCNNVKSAYSLSLIGNNLHEDPEVMLNSLNLINKFKVQLLGMESSKSHLTFYIYGENIDKHMISEFHDFFIL